MSQSATRRGKILIEAMSYVRIARQMAREDKQAALDNLEKGRALFLSVADGDTPADKKRTLSLFDQCRAAIIGHH